MVNPHFCNNKLLLTSSLESDLELNAASAVCTVSDWKELGHQIDYNPIKLVRLLNSGQSSDKCREEMVADWARQSGASWEKLARALDRMDEKELAEKIRHDYDPPPPLSINEGNYTVFKCNLY